MEKLTQIISYLLDKYPYKRELSNARVTKMIYLADWRNSIIHKKQISNIDWYFDNYGPFVWDVYKNVTDNDDIFDVINDTNMYGVGKRILFLNKKIDCNLLSEDDINVLDRIIESTKALNWNQFIRLVYSTYPVISSERYKKLNLAEKAEEFINKKNEEALKSAH